jgi:tRNA U34 5-carboxymethylaminomethyl modifying GTPase MnmE/TrmE
MQNVNEQLKKTLNIMNQRQTIDLTLEFLQTALKNIDHILGNTKEYNFINELFRKFCLGK